MQCFASLLLKHANTVSRSAASNARQTATVKGNKERKEKRKAIAFSAPYCERTVKQRGCFFFFFCTMPTLADEAEAEFQRLRQEDNPYFVIKLRTGDYDFLTAEEPTIVPIHIIEARRQEELRRGVVDTSATLLDFLKSIGVDASDTRDPVNGHSTLELDESTRAYYGNPKDEAYRAYRMQMLRFADDEQWLKEKTFLEGQMVYDYAQMRYSERKREQTEQGPMQPVTNFRKTFFERMLCNRAPVPRAEEKTPAEL
jgi:hypothetical protein